MSASTARSIPESQFFKEIFGFSESLEAVTQNLEVSEADRTFWMTSKANGKKFRCGTFKAKAIGDFNSDFAERKGFQFNVLAGRGGSTENFADVDVGGQQAKPENRGATFQVASNFNGLEFVSAGDSAKRGVTRYIYDPTQGPAASISAAPATVYRNYFVRHKPEGGDEEYTGQLEKQLNLLERHPEIPVRNGYIEFRNSTLTALHDREPRFEKTDDISNVKVGVHTNVQVTSGVKHGGTVELCEDPDQVITQVFTAAMNMPGVPFLDTPWRDEFCERIAQWILRASYRGTILAAVENALAQPSDREGRNKLYLTLMGGGVFGNDHAWIVDAILENKPLLQRSGLQVYLLLYTKRSMPGVQLRRLEQLCQESGGSVVDVA